MENELRDCNCVDYRRSYLDLSFDTRNGMSNDPMAALIAPRERHHNVKCGPEYFCETLHGFKTFEIRKNDRDYRVRDTVTLHEWDYAIEEYTGRSLRGRIGYLYQDEGMAHGYCCFVLDIDESEKKMYRNTP